MRTIMAALAALLLVAGPANASTTYTTSGALGWKPLYLNATGGTGTVTARATWSPRAKGGYYLSLSSNASTWPECVIYTGQPSGPTPPVGDWTCAIDATSGYYTATFRTLDGGNVGTVRLTMTVP